MISVCIFQYARQLINVCKELPAVKSAQSPGKVLWSTSVVIFSNQNTGKRVRLGNQAMFPKDTYRKFILTINVCICNFQQIYISEFGMP